MAEAIAGSVLTVVTYFGLTGSAVGPAYGNVGPDAVSMGARPAQAATLSMKNGDPVITGSVARMFQSASFVGPNEVAKTNRARIDVDVMSLTKTFALARERMTSLRQETQIALDASLLKPDSIVNQSPYPPAVQVASISPQGVATDSKTDLVPPPVDSPALAAIDRSVAPDAGAPTPLSVPTQLAYARANAPETSFEDTQSQGKFSSKDLWCMSEAIYFEARGESYRGQVAVAQVVMNRLHHPLYPKTICGVVFQNANMRNACQFSFACDGIPETVTDKKSWAQAEEIAKKVTSGELYLSEVGNATHYHAAYVYPDWAPRLKRVTRIGEHIFYRFKKSG